MKIILSHFLARLFYKKVKNTPLVVYGCPKIGVALYCFLSINPKSHHENFKRINP